MNSIKKIYFFLFCLLNTSFICSEDLYSLITLIKNQGYLSYIDKNEIKSKQLKIRKLNLKGNHSKEYIGLKLTSDKSNKDYTYLIKILRGNWKREINNFIEIKNKLENQIKKYNNKNFFKISLPKEVFSFKHNNQVYPICVLDYEAGDTFTSILKNYDGTSTYEQVLSKALKQIGKALGIFHYQNRTNKLIANFSKFKTITHNDFYGHNIIVDLENKYKIAIVDNERMAKSLKKLKSPLKDLIFFYVIHTFKDGACNPVISKSKWHKIISNFFNGYVESYPTIYRKQIKTCLKEAFINYPKNFYKWKSLCKWTNNVWKDARKKILSCQKELSNIINNIKT